MIDGRVSIYTEGPGDDDAESCLSLIQNGMSGDSLLDAHSDIKGLTYVGTELPRNIADDLLNDGLKDDDITLQQEGAVWNPVYTVGIAATSIALVGFASFARYRAKKRAQYDDVENDFESVDWEDAYPLRNV